MSGPRTIMHVDMDAFFASVEIRDDPRLRGKPVLVGGGGRRSVVAAASYEARRFGCHSAQPLAVALRRCPQAVVVPPRHERYLECSQQILAIFERFTPLVEPISIDEAFLDLSGTERLHGAPRIVAERLRAGVRDELGLTCSVGVASCKLVAKIASERHKPDGMTFVAAGGEREFLAPLPIRALWGIGPKTERALRQLGVARIGELAAIDAARLRERLGDHGADLLRRARGEDERPVAPARAAAQVSHEDTFDEDLVGRRALCASLLQQATRVADRLVRGGVRGRKVVLKLRDTDFVTETRQTTLDPATADAREIYRAAVDLLDKLELAGRRFRLTGVAVADLREASGEPPLPPVGAQLELLAPGGEVEEARREGAGQALQSVITAVRGRYGSDALYPAASARRPTRRGGEGEP